MMKVVGTSDHFAKSLSCTRFGMHVPAAPLEKVGVGKGLLWDSVKEEIRDGVRGSVVEDVKALEGLDFDGSWIRVVISRGEDGIGGGGDGS